MPALHTCCRSAALIDAAGTLNASSNTPAVVSRSGDASCAATAMAFVAKDSASRMRSGTWPPKSSPASVHLQGEVPSTLTSCLHAHQTVWHRLINPSRSLACQHTSANTVHSYRLLPIACSVHTERDHAKEPVECTCEGSAGIGHGTAAGCTTRKTSHSPQDDAARDVAHVQPRGQLLELLVPGIVAGGVQLGILR